MEATMNTEATNPNRTKFVIGGLMIVILVVYLIWSSTAVGAQYYHTIEELNSRGEGVVGQSIRVSGAVIGDSIQYDPDTLTLSFSAAHLPGDNQLIEEEGGLAEALHKAVMDTTRPRIEILYIGVMPDLLRNEAQAIMTGTLGEDGIFYADELLLKCPTRYEEAVPDQVDA
jgi:cytochrome c-type biogenesis protein CcmE